MKKTLYFLIFFIAIFAFRQADAASLNLTAEKNTYKIGDTFDLNVKIDSEGTGINGVQTTIKFDKALVEAVKTDKTGSIFDFWLVDPVIAPGEVSFIAASTSGHDGKSLQALKITFKAKGSGTVNFTLSDAAITAADGSGSNILSKTNNVTLTFASSVGETKPTQIVRTPVFAAGSPEKPKLSVPLYPQPDKWYNVSEGFLANVALTPDVSDVAMVLNKTPGTTPTVSEGLFESKPFDALQDGLYFIHARYKNNIGWGPVEHYKIGVDTAPPTDFLISFPGGTPTDDPNPEVVYKSTDALSGITRYEIYIDDNAPIIVSQFSTKLPSQVPGHHNIRIVAYDQAGNATENSGEYEILSIPAPIIDLVNKNVFTDAGGFFISGTADTNLKVRVELKDGDGNIAFSDLLIPDGEGKWSANPEILPKRGDYIFEIATVDERGAVSTIVVSDEISVRARPIFTLGPLRITLAWFFFLFAIIVAGSFALGWWSIRFAQNERSLESFLAERDIDNIFNGLKKDIKVVLSKYTDGDLGEQGTMETKMLLEKMLSQLEKTKDYVKGDVADIEKDQGYFFIFLKKKIKDLLHIKD